MKKHLLISLALIAILFEACSTTSFSEYRGPAVVQGKGGTVRSVDGIDFWENGEPDRKFKILGVIDDSRGDALLLRKRRDGDIAKMAHSRGGDAVVVVRRDQQVSGLNPYTRNVEYNQFTKLLLVKYVQ